MTAHTVSRWWRHSSDVHTRARAQQAPKRVDESTIYNKYVITGGIRKVTSRLHTWYVVNQADIYQKTGQWLDGEQRCWRLPRSAPRERIDWKTPPLQKWSPCGGGADETSS